MRKDISQDQSTPKPPDWSTGDGTLRDLQSCSVQGVSQHRSASSLPPVQI